MKVLVKIVVLMALATSAFAAGGTGRKSIADIEANPSRYQGKKVKVQGIVKDSYGFSVPGTGMGGGAYKIDDGTGAIWVMVTEGSVPSNGMRLTVEGRVANGVNWKGRNYGLGLSEEKRHYEKR